MAEPTKLPVNTEKANAPSLQGWRPFDNLRREIDRVFEDFHGGLFRTPSLFDQLPGLARARSFALAPAVDVAEHDKAYEVTAELPGLDEKNVEVKVASGVLSIKGEKQEDKEETKKDYYVRERSFGSFERSFQIPDGVDSDKIEAVFKQGVLKVTLPKKPEVQKAAKTIDIKAA
ncbi:putative HspC2 heat shock protein [Bradyrhizobium sp. ORS 278]|uniref:Hsp20/alpha crystallin family protein n=1 Tax=Bradyrhizobium sp. (strain ORS 278) TaxID=114615 RepID=UPI0001507F54|nr:Hsp20/alpha crystallin family protein [Bradyrhizobium sp. ORS 278]CAL78396.1 putative HspC2 heat shock protein [Bradyrhizobium sp. ORS 278]